MELFKIFGTIALKGKEQFNAGIDESSEKASKFSDKLKSGLATAAKIGAAAVTAVATAAGVAAKAFGDGISQTAAYGDNIDKMSQKMGMSAKSYQEWDFIMQHCGTSIESMQVGMKTLATAAESGSDAFAKLGMSQEAIANMSQEELFESTITALQNVGDETERTYLAGQLLGRGATELGALLNTSAEDVEAMRQQVNDLGGVMSDEAVKAAAAYQDSLQNMKTAFSGIGRNLLSGFLPSITTVMDGLAAIFSGNDSGVSLLADGLEKFVNKLSAALPKVMDSGSKIITTLAGALMNNLPMLLTAATNMVLTVAGGLINQLPQITEAALSMIITLINGLASDPESLVATAITLVVTIVSGLIDAIPQLIAAAADLVTGLNRALISNAPNLLSAGLKLVGKIVEGIVNSLGEIAKAGAKVVDSIIDGIAGAWGKLKDWFKGLWNGLFGGLSANVSVNGSAKGAAVGVNGSHASGLDYVPFDGYIAELHKGEMVVPKREAQTLRNSEETDYLLRQILDCLKSSQTININNREFGRLVRGVT